MALLFRNSVVNVNAFEHAKIAYTRTCMQDFDDLSRMQIVIFGPFALRVE